MTREEAIEYAESKKMRLEALVYNDDCKYGNYAMYSGELSFVNAALSALRPVSREQVEKAWKGEWILHENKDDVFSSYHTCSRCGSKFGEALHIDVFHLDFCPVCHAAMTDEAVEDLKRKWEDIR